MSRVAFLGLGRMGSLMARRLVDAGHDVTVWNRTAARADPLVTAGARAAATPHEAVTGASVVITMLADPPAVESVLADAAPALGPSATVVEMSTIGPDAVITLAGRLPGVDLADAPVKGSLPAAESGDLVILFGGSAETLSRVREVLDVLGTIEHVGPLGAGAATKLIVNVALIATYALIGEALALGDRMGLATATTLDALSGTVVGSMIPRVQAAIDQPEGPAGFAYGLAAKDLRLAVEAGAPPDGLIAAALGAFTQGLPGAADGDIGRIIGVLR
jgi:3-hydroxyisobutyrate dehydrogenase